MSLSFSAEVVAVFTTPTPAAFPTCVVPSLALDLGGIQGDRHHGFTRPAGARERWYKAGTEIRSGRQLTLVSREDLAEIATAMDLPRIDPGWIGANIVIAGIPAFTLLPWGTRLFFGEGAVLVNEGDNAPCRFAGAKIAQAYAATYPARAGLDMLFVQAAKNRRGIVASVERAGVVTPGPVRVKLTQPTTLAGSHFMTIIPVTLFTSGVLGLLYITLTVQVLRQRQKHDVSLGDGGNEALQIAIRGHGNFGEYVPLALILLGGIEWAGAAHWLCVLLALMLLVGRFAHPFGLMRPPPNLPRALGTGLTLTMILIASLWAVLDTI